MINGNDRRRNTTITHTKSSWVQNREFSFTDKFLVWWWSQTLRRYAYNFQTLFQTITSNIDYFRNQKNGIDYWFLVMLISNSILIAEFTYSQTEKLNDSFPRPSNANDCVMHEEHSVINN